MKLINATLQEKQLKLSDLSDELKDRVNVLKQMIITYNMACEEYENLNLEQEDATVVAQLDTQEEFIATSETEISELIKLYQKPAPVVPVVPVAPVVQKPIVPIVPIIPKSVIAKKADKLGWLIFAGVVFITTLGAANIFKKE